MHFRFAACVCERSAAQQTDDDGVFFFLLFCVFVSLRRPLLAHSWLADSIARRRSMAHRASILCTL